MRGISFEFELSLISLIRCNFDDCHKKIIEVKIMAFTSRVLLAECCFKVHLLYLSLSTRALIGQFCGPDSSVRPAVRPAKFENLVQQFVTNMSREEKFDTYLKELRTNR